MGLPQLSALSDPPRHVSGLPTEYGAYLGREWELFASDPARQDESRALAGRFSPRRVLDVGCGGGQDLIPFAAHGATCVGVDVARESADWATRKFQCELPGTATSFVTGAAEALPFRDGSFDLVICRLAIPYTDNAAAFAEMSRVLSNGGGLLLKTHTPSYYFRKFWDGVRMRSPLFSVHAVRVLVSGLLYHVTGRQPAGGVLLREVFQTRQNLRKELARVGLHIERELTDSTPQTRGYLITKS